MNSTATHYIESIGIIDVEVVDFPMINVPKPSSISKYNSYEK